MHNKVLILFAHPALEKSRINKPMADAVKNQEHVTFRDLYEEYPDFNIRVPDEQELLILHEIIVFQHPFYWYSCPSLLKEWLDLTLQYNFAYGNKGNALEGKKLLSVITTGAIKEAYQQDGFHGCEMREFLLPFIQTARLCRMQYLPPYIIHGTHLMQSKEVIAECAEDYKKLIIELTSGEIDFEGLEAKSYWNE